MGKAAHRRRAQKAVRVAEDVGPRQRLRACCAKVVSPGESESLRPLTGGLPLGLGGQTLARPLAIGPGAIEGNLHDRMILEPLLGPEDGVDLLDENMGACHLDQGDTFDAPVAPVVEEGRHLPVRDFVQIQMEPGVPYGHHLSGVRTQRGRNVGGGHQCHCGQGQYRQDPAQTHVHPFLLM